MKLKKKDLETIKEAHSYYDQLIGEPLIYVYVGDKNKYKYLKVDFRSSNFMHLCGVNYYHKGRISPKEFYNALSHNNLDLDKVDIKKDGTTQLKLQVIKDIKFLNTCQMRVVDNQLTLFHAEFEKSLKRKNFLLLGLRYTKEFYVPSSIFNARTVKLKTNLCEVLAVFRGEISKDKKLDAKPSFDLEKALKLNVI
ncbi:PBECR4 domain-containing protein [Salinicoccus halitifaciens]|uniref:Phage-Barnase-EndoU-ColicinE5/D-RelE like nuclease 4 domain-containing protein n=1 Tax=Salinicoccus halitifaciens TaxID=1073415 RepID=A0ABV2E5R1_9STAP|nr:PBECR4 domain-containing protein [Salinicoccus halitifaciens]MCD2137158.1 PBECR4 domain-containing protein [Salinicoccus halitifaciens]